MQEQDLIKYCQERINFLNDRIKNDIQAKSNKYFKQYLKGEKAEITMLLNKIDNNPRGKATCLF